MNGEHVTPRPSSVFVTVAERESLLRLPPQLATAAEWLLGQGFTGLTYAVGLAIIVARQLFPLRHEDGAMTKMEAQLYSAAREFLTASGDVAPGDVEKVATLFAQTLKSAEAAQTPEEFDRLIVEAQQLFSQQLAKL